MKSAGCRYVVREATREKVVKRTVGEMFCNSDDAVGQFKAHGIAPRYGAGTLHGKRRER